MLVVTSVVTQAAIDGNEAVRRTSKSEEGRGQRCFQIHRLTVRLQIYY